MRIASRQPTDRQPDEHDQVDDDQPDRLVGAVARAARQLGAVPERRDPADPLQVDRQRRDREDRAAEQGDRQQNDAHDDRELAAVFGDARGVGEQGQSEREAGQHGDRDDEHTSRQRDRAEEQHDQVVDGRGGRHAQDDEHHDPVHHLPAAQRGRVHGDERRVPLEPEHDRVGELLGRDHQRSAADERRGDEGQVADPVDRVRAEIRADERGEPDAEGEQVQEGRSDRRRDHRAAVGAGDPEAVLGDVPGAEAARLGARDACLLREGVDDGHSIRLRPVSRRNTSSRLERRTRLVTGCSPRAVSSTSAASPSWA